MNLLVWYLAEFWGDKFASVNDCRVKTIYNLYLTDNKIILYDNKRKFSIHDTILIGSISWEQVHIYELFKTKTFVKIVHIFKLSVETDTFYNLESWQKICIMFFLFLYWVSSWLVQQLHGPIICWLMIRTPYGQMSY